jgi:hypothetical protein
VRIYNCSVIDTDLIRSLFTFVHYIFLILPTMPGSRKGSSRKGSAKGSSKGKTRAVAQRRKDAKAIRAVPVRTSARAQHKADEVAVHQTKTIKSRSGKRKAVGAGYDADEGGVVAPGALSVAAVSYPDSARSNDSSAKMVSAIIDVLNACLQHPEQDWEEDQISRIIDWYMVKLPKITHEITEFDGDVFDLLEDVQVRLSDFHATARTYALVLSGIGTLTKRDISDFKTMKPCGPAIINNPKDVDSWNKLLQMRWQDVKDVVAGTIIDLQAAAE